MWFANFRRHHQEHPDGPAGEDRIPAHHPSRAGELGDEVEAFVNGHLVEHLMARGRAVPPWAALNRLAHGTVEELQRTIATEGDPSGDGKLSRSWADTERALARRVLFATYVEGVAGIQRSVLVPLELAMIQQHKSARVTADQALDAATEALDKHLQDH